MVFLDNEGYKLILHGRRERIKENLNLTHLHVKKKARKLFEAGLAEEHLARNITFRDVVSFVLGIDVLLGLRVDFVFFLLEATINPSNTSSSFSLFLELLLPLIRTLM